MKQKLINGIYWDEENVFIEDENLQEGMYNHKGRTYFTWEAAMAYAKSINKRLPSKEEWDDLIESSKQKLWDIDNKGLYVHGLFFQAAGYRNNSNATVNNVGSNGYYWSSTVNGTNSYNLNFNSTNVNPVNNNNRPYGFSVRLLKDIDRKNI